MVDHGKALLVPFPELMEELIEILHDDAVELGCAQDVLHIRKIIADGTSADRQHAVGEAALKSGATSEEAMREVVDHLVREFPAQA